MFVRKAITLDSLRVSYEESENSGKTLMFFHGAGVTPFTYSNLLTRFAKDYHVIAPDIPGFGRSTAPKSIWNYDDYAYLFSQFITRLDLPDVIGVGHSFGGSIALHLAAKNKQVTKVIGINATGLPTSYPFSQQVYRFVLLKTIHSYIGERQGFSMTRSCGDFLVSFLRNSRSFRHMVRVVRNCVLDESRFYEHVSIPVLLLASNRDELLPVSDVQKTARLFKNVTAKIADGNHDWYLSKPDEVVKRIEDFIEKTE
jgi:2-hydroxy-6-oxonona-2,4-dienedioate hydrolase